MYESLTAFIPDLEKGGFGDWSEQTGDGTPENPLVFCHIEFSEQVRGLVDALFSFKRDHEELNLSDYPDLEKEIADRWQGESIHDIDPSVLDGRLTVGVLLLVVSMSRFDDTAFLSFCESGATLRCLKRLKEIDETGKEADT